MTEILNSELSYYIMSAVFVLSFVVESAVTGKLFMQRDNLPVTGFMRWWAVGAVTYISIMNLVGWLRLHENHAKLQVDPGNVIQAMFALGPLAILAWVWVFHIERWKAK